MLTKILKAVFGSKSGRDVKRLLPKVAKINELEIEYQKLSEEALKAKTTEFQERLRNGETTDDILCEAFAVVKNACRRLCGTTITVCDHELVWDMIPFDVQLIGGIVLHQGKIAEMATGEGKTLVATLPLYLNALTGRNCQLVTVNDYLARRDSEWMGTVFQYLGLTVGCIQNEMDPPERREQYNCDITYGTNSEFGFDYLRDMGMATRREHLVQRNHFYAIIDEVDSILIDEARTPLIISGPVAVSTSQFEQLKPAIADLYNRQNLLCGRLIQEARSTLSKENPTDDEMDEAIRKLLQVKLGMPQHKQLMHILESAEILKRLEKMEMFVKSDQNRGMLQEVQSELFFAMDEKHHEADLTEKGRLAVSPSDPNAFVLPDLLESIHAIDTAPSLSVREKAEKKQAFQQEFAEKSERLQNLSQLLRAYCLFEKDVHYVVADNKVLIVDEHTGRILPGRRFSDGLHQALEAKENVEIEKETQTLATITIQNYFRMYEKLAGMTGTAETEANEFHQIYKLDVVVIPTNKPCQRFDHNDCVYKTKREKFNAIVNETEEAYKKGQPVLLGTISVEDSELVSRLLKLRKIPHNVLNAKNHAMESDIVARAGQKYAVTVATNMAGRGTDIKLGEGVADLGGLYVIGSSRHDSRRIDRQLRGRSARQGDPGASRFYVSLEDNLMRLFGSDRIVRIMERFGLEEGEELQHPWLTKSIETAQRRVEQHHFSIRKRTLEYDDVMNKQREVIYGFRKETLFNDNCREEIFMIVDTAVFRHVEDAIAATDKDSSVNAVINRDSLLAWLNMTFPIGFDEKTIFKFKPGGEPDVNAMCDAIVARVKEMYSLKESVEDPEGLIWLERHLILSAVDRLWQDHLYAMDNLRSSIGLRAYAQKDPLVEYKQEAFKMFDILMQDIDQEILTNMFRSATSIQAFEQMFASMPMTAIHESLDQFADAPRQEGGRALPEGQPAEEAPEINISFKRDVPKVGRNDLCPCGSGKKYKKCCGK
ncbi:MAG: preprotein translocase subunit SecA [Lentisphaerae bacterium ADurb.Bin242]|nr:MAG: preprotein translocase subunit SecA [Lentisphaerae bacterium ADurb.Bin242]